MIPHFKQKFPGVVLIIALIACALLPWFRNRGYLRDLYD
jgi:predicted acetyltransferase